ISQPTLFVAGERYGVLKFMGRAFETLEENVPRLSKKVLIPGKGHWIQQEDPREVHRLILQFLKEL
ncbi:MAG: alpha/beta hydrolase, partial [Roseibacillus sp.]|nr:alpha/beta hydrolase [Roseibacillus sp.]